MNKNRALRTALVAIPLLILCLLALCFVALNTAAFRDFVRSEIRKQALAHVGVLIEVQSVETHWARLSLDLNGIVVYGNANLIPNQPALLRASRLQVGVRFLPLLRKRFELRELILDQPILRVNIDSQGRSNLPVLLHTPSGGSGPNTAFDLAISDCAIRSGEIEYNDRRIPLDVELHGLRFEVRYSVLAAAYRGSLSYASGRLAARGISPVGHALSLQFSANRSGLSLNPLVVSTGASRISLSAQLENYANPNLSGNYQASVFTGDIGNAFSLLSLPIGTVTATGALDYRSGRHSLIENLTLQGQAQSDQLLLRTSQRLVPITGVSALYKLRGGTLRVQNLAANLLGGHAQATWEMQYISAPNSESRLDLSLKDASLKSASDALAPAGMHKIPFVGSTNVDLQARWSGAIANAVVHARLAASGGQQTVASDSIPVNGLVDVEYDGPHNSLAFAPSHIGTASTNLTINGTLDPRRGGKAALDVQAETSDLREVASLAALLQSAVESSKPVTAIPTLGGSATFTAHITGTAKVPRIDGRLTAQNLTVDQSRWRALALNLTASPSNVAMQNGALTGLAREQIAFSGEVGLRDWSLVPEGSIRLQASVANLTASEAQAISRVRYPITGMLAANVSVSGTKSAPNGQASLTLTKGSAWNQPIDSLTVNAESRQGSVHSTLAVKAPAGGLSADATYVLATQHYDVTLHGSGIDTGKLGGLEQRAPLQGIVDLAVAGSGTIHDPQLQVNLTASQLLLREQTIHDVAAHVTVAHQHANLDLHSMVDQGSVEAKGDVSLTGNFDASATLDVLALPIATVAANFIRTEGSKLGGQTEVHLTLKGPLKTPAQIQAHLEIPTLGATFGKAEMTLASPLRADYSGGVLTLAPTRIQGTGTNLTFGGTIPIERKAAYTLAADGSMDLGVVQQFVPGVRSSGQMEVHIHGEGGSGRPTMQGQFRIKNMVFSTDTIPVGVEGLNAQVNLNGDRAEITDFSGTAGGGTISARGYVLLRSQPDFNLSLNAQSVRVRYPAGLRSSLSGQINMQGSPRNSSLTGQVVVNKLSFTQEFDLANFAGELSQDTGGSSASPFQNNLKLNISVKSSQDINLASNKLSMGGSANIAVIGTLANPVLLGRIALTSGEVFFLGKRFEVQSGTIEFANPVRTSPVLNLFVVTTIEQYDVTLNLAGPVDRLRTNYTSQPSLPPADIIHLLAFGNTAEEAASALSTSAAMGAESLLAQGVSSQVAGKLEKLSGISQLTIDPLAANSQGNPGAQVAIQERVTGSLLLTFSTDVTTTQSETIEVQYSFSRRLSVTVLRDQNGGYGIDLRIHKVF